MTSRRPKLYRVTFKFFTVELESQNWLRVGEYTTASVAMRRDASRQRNDQPPRFFRAAGIPPYGRRAMGSRRISLAHKVTCHVQAIDLAARRVARKPQNVTFKQHIQKTLCVAQ